MVKHLHQQHQQQPDGVVAGSRLHLQSWLQPALLTMTEVLLLDNRRPPALTSGIHLSFWTALTLIGNNIEVAAAVEVLKVLLQPLYFLLIEDVIEFIDSSGAADMWKEAEASVGSEGKEQAQHTFHNWLTVTCSFLPQVPSQQVARIILEHPLATLPALETLVRGTASGQPTRSELDTLVVANCTLKSLQLFISNPASAAEADPLADVRLQKQLASIICSCLKVAGGVGNGCSAQVQDDLKWLCRAVGQILACIRKRVMVNEDILPMSQQIWGGYSDSDTLDRWPPGVTQEQVIDYEAMMLLASPWMALTGRGILVISNILQQQTPIDPQFLHLAQLWVDRLDDQIGQLDLPGDPCRAIPHKHRLKRNLDNVYVVIYKAQLLVEEGRSITGKAAVKLSERLQRFGSLLCGAIPLESVCNNPSCLNLAKLSELELVAGKGSRCSGCKVARYCSKDCQVEHWKHHKAACRSLQGAATANNI